MTMPHLSNCPHSSDGWCLKCVGELKQENDELNKLFELRHKADVRAIEQWREKTGKKVVLPDHADLCAWLIEKIDAMEAEIARLTEKTKPGE